MKFSRNTESVLVAMTILVLAFVSIFSIGYGRNNTFAETEDATFAASEDYFVTFYDDGERLTVKTSAATVGEAIERVGITLNETDIVEPGLSESINSNNFFINIYRSHPAVVKDGRLEKYLMTASYDAKTVAKEAGITVYDSDEIKLVQNKNFLEAGAVMAYEITRNGGRTLTEEIEIPFEEETVKDYNLEPGTKEVRQFGEIGIKLLTYEVFYENGVEMDRKLISEEIKREPVTRIVAVGASEIERYPLTVSMGRNRYTFRRADGVIIERQETYYDLNMSGVMANAARTCGVEGYYTIREDGVKVDADGYVIVAANLELYPRCSVVETSLGLGKVYDTGSFAVDNPEQFDIATDWTNRNGQ